MGRAFPHIAERRPRYADCAAPRAPAVPVNADARARRTKVASDASVAGSDPAAPLFY